MDCAEVLTVAVPRGFLPTQTAVESLTIGVGVDGSPTARKGAPVNFDRCRINQVTVLSIVPTTNGECITFKRRQALPRVE